MECDTQHRETWETAGISDFDQFLRSYDLCEPYRYRLFVRGVQRFSLKEALENGAHWTMHAGKMNDGTPETNLSEYRERAVAFREVHGTMPSEQTVSSWRLELNSKEPKPHGVIRKADEIHRLRAENARLKAENQALKKRIAELEAKAA